MNEVILKLFRSYEVYIRLLNWYKGETKYREEFLRFYTDITTDPEYKKNGVPFEYFKAIPVELRAKQ